MRDNPAGIRDGMVLGGSFCERRNGGRTKSDGTSGGGKEGKGKTRGDICNKRINHHQLKDTSSSGRMQPGSIPDPTMTRRFTPIYISTYPVHDVHPPMADLEFLYNENCFGPPSLPIDIPAFARAAKQLEALGKGNPWHRPASSSDANEPRHPISNWQEWSALPDEERTAIEEECR